jgi:hypothetical protein
MVGASSPSVALGCTNLWDGGSGDWDDPDNWKDYEVPGPGSVACIPNVGAAGPDVEIRLPDDELTVTGINNSEVLVVPDGTTVTLPAGGQVINSGVWRFTGAGSLLARVEPGALGPFVNMGGARIEKFGSGAVVLSGLANQGRIHVAAGTVELSQPVDLDASTYEVSVGASLQISSVDEMTNWGGTHDLEGGGTVVVTGEIDASGVSWAFDPGEAVVNGTIDTTPYFFHVDGVLQTYDLRIRGELFDVNPTGTVRQEAGVTVTLDEKASVTNYGVWHFVGDGAVVGTAGGEPEKFNNLSGLIDKSEVGSVEFDTEVQVFNHSSINVNGGNLDLVKPAYLDTSTYDVQRGGSLRIHSVDGVTQWEGTHDLTGGGTLFVDGEVDTTIGVQWAFDPSEAIMNATIDTTDRVFTVAGVLHTSNLTIKGGQSFNIASTGVVAPSAGAMVTLAEATKVDNFGLWQFAGTGRIQGTPGGEPESFVNYNDATIANVEGGVAEIIAVHVDNSGNIRATNGSLSISALEQLEETTLTNGDYFADDADILLPANITTNEATIRLNGTGSLPQIDTLTENNGLLHLSGGAHVATSHSLNNNGTIRVGPRSTLSVLGTFTTWGEVITDIGGPSTSDDYGIIAVAGDAELHGTYRVITDPTFTPEPGEIYDVLRYASRTGQFSDHEGMNPHYGYAYDLGSATVFRLTVKPPSSSISPGLTQRSGEVGTAA